jgi:hypothetical protein
VGTRLKLEVARFEPKRQSFLCVGHSLTLLGPRLRGPPPQRVPFDRRFGVLLGGTRKELEQRIREGFPFLRLRPRSQGHFERSALVAKFFGGQPRAAAAPGSEPGALPNHAATPAVAPPTLPAGAGSGLKKKREGS